MPDLNLGRPGLSVLPLGVGDAFSAVHYPTCMLVSRYTTPAWDNEMILIDCPQSIRKMMREVDDGQFHGLDLHRVNTLILTHLHTDHASGLETIAAFFKIALGRKLRLVALPEVIEGIPPFLKAIEMMGTMHDLFDVVPIIPGKPTTLGVGDTAFDIEVHQTMHPIPTCGLRITLDGKTFAYSCDTTFDKDLWEWLWEDDPGFVIHEVGHGLHTSYDDLMAHRSTLGRKLRLIHYPDDMIPMLEASPLHLMREGCLEIV